MENVKEQKEQIVSEIAEGAEEVLKDAIVVDNRNIGRGATHPIIRWDQEQNDGPSEDVTVTGPQALRGVQAGTIHYDEVGYDANANDSKEPTPEEVPQSELDSMNSARQLFGMGTALKQVRDTRKQIDEQRSMALGENSDEYVKYLEASIKDLTIDQIRALTPEQLESIYAGEEKKVELALNFSTEAEASKFRKEFLIYMKESSSAIEMIDLETERLEVEMNKSKEEFDVLLREHGTMDGYISNKLNSAIDMAEGPKKDHLLQVKKAYDDAATLEPIIEHYKKFSTANTIGDVQSDTRSQLIYNKYKNKLAAMKVKTDLTDFGNISQHLPEKYAKYGYVLQFAIIKYIAYKKVTEATVDGVFLSQVAVNLRSLVTNNFVSDERKETFTNSICKALDLFID